MKKTILALIALLTFAIVSARAQSVSVILPGTTTNSTIYWGSNSAVVLNRLPANQSFTAPSASSNLAYIVTNMPVFVTGNTVGVVAGMTSAAVGTNSYTVQASYLTAGPWDTITNFSVLNPGGGRARSNFTVTVSGYNYLKISDITNASAGICASNYVSFHQKN